MTDDCLDSRVMSSSSLSSSTIAPVEALKRAKTIAVVGASKNPEKDAHTVPRFLKEKGYRIVPINPSALEIFGEKAFPDLLSIPADLASQVDTIEVFRPSEELAMVALNVVELAKKQQQSGHYVFWAQLGLESDDAKRILDQAGIPYVMNACMKVVYGLLSPSRG
jgi:uncharacterized protein